MGAGATVNFPWEKVSIAPMMDITDRRFRYFMRLINARVRLYTEMIVCHAIVRGDRERLLKFDGSEHPVTLQLGGDDPALVAEAAKIGADFGYDAVDLNCGCPSDRVESGNFGVCLMRTPDKVAEIVGAMVAAVKIPVSVKCRIGITGEESEEHLHSFAEKIFVAGASSLTVHARTATLGGFSPKQNREIPPLEYDIVYRLKQKFHGRQIEINGGIKTLEQIESHLDRLDRVMLGRLAHEDPFFFSDGRFSRMEVFERMGEYAASHERNDISAAKFFANMLNLFHALPGARLTRRFISEEGRALSPQAAADQLKTRLLAAMAPSVY